MSVTSGVPTNKTFRANGMFDPDFSLGGHQPYGFDQLMARYNHYTVVGAKISIRFHGGGMRQSLVGCLLSGSSVPGTATTPHQLEGSRFRYKYVPTGGTQSGFVRANFSAKRFFSRKSVVGESDLKGSATADPTEQAYFIVRLMDPEQLPSPGNIDAHNFTVMITYIAMFSEPKAITQS